MSQDQRQVFIVDDDASVRKSLERLLRISGYAVRTLASAEEFFATDHSDAIACVVLDLAMTGQSGLEVQKWIAAQNLRYGIVFLTGHGDLATGVHAIKDGADDFLTKPVDEAYLLSAVDKALARQGVNYAHQTRVADAQSRFTTLTSRERQVMEYVVIGRLNKQISAELNISEKTVKAHRAQVMRKTGAGSLAELVRLYLLAQPPIE